MGHKKASLLTTTFAAAVFVAILFAGCSKPFVPYFSSKSAPAKAPMVNHWDIFATDVAVQTKMALETAGIYDDLSIYVETSEETDFGNTFRDLLRVRLEELGLPVIHDKKEAVFVMENSVQVLCHLTREIVDPPADRSAAFVNLSEDVAVERGGDKTADAKEVETTDDIQAVRSAGVFAPTEVAITTSLVNETDLLLQTSDIYYINDPEFWRYMADSRMHEQISEEQITETTSEQAPVVGPIPVSEQPAEEMPAEMPEKLPELKVKGHF